MSVASLPPATPTTESPSSLSPPHLQLHPHLYFPAHVRALLRSTCDSSNTEMVVQLNVPPSSTSSQLSWKVHPRMTLPRNQQDSFGQHYHSQIVHSDLSNWPKRKSAGAQGSRCGQGSSERVEL